MTSARTAPPMKTMSFLHGGIYLRLRLPVLYLSSGPLFRIILRKQCFQDGGSYLRDVCKNGTTDEDHVLPPRRNIFATKLACTVLFLWSIITDCSAQTVFPRWRLIPSYTSARTAPPMKTMSFLHGRIYLQLSLPVLYFFSGPLFRIVLRKQCFQDGGSYLHNVSKNGTTDQDHVLPPRRNIFATKLACTVLFLWSIIPDCSAQTVFPRWQIIPS
jgi:hypothetical protein